MWSLATETRKVITNNTEWIPVAIDPQYVVGFNWERQYGARVVKNFGDKFAFGGVGGKSRNDVSRWPRIQHLHEHVGDGNALRPIRTRLCLLRGWRWTVELLRHDRVFSE